MSGPNDTDAILGKLKHLKQDEEADLLRLRALEGDKERLASEMNDIEIEIIQIEKKLKEYEDHRRKIQVVLDIADEDLEEALEACNTSATVTH